MSYFRKSVRRSMSGLFDSGPQLQQPDVPNLGPQLVVPGSTSSSTSGCPSGQEKNAYGYCVPSSSSSSDSGFSWGNLLKGLTAGAATPQPTVVQASSGMSTTTLALIGGGALLLIALIASKD